MALHKHGLGFWVVMVVAVIMVMFGLPILGGGIWLITLGGSWYYALAGLGLLAAAVFLFRRSIAGVWIYLVTFAATIAWALWEKGMDGWAQVPRIVAPTVILVLVLLTIPAMRSKISLPRRSTAAVAGAIVIFGCLGVALTSVHPTNLLAQEATPPAGAPSEPATPLAPVNPATNPPTPEGTANPSAAAAQAPAAVTDRPALDMPEPGTDWPAWGGSIHGTRYSPLDQITPDNVSKLQRVWEFHTGDMPSKAANGEYSPENTPLKVGNTFFVCSAMGIVIGVDAATGKEEWRYDPHVSTDAIPYGATCRGVAYFQVPGANPDNLCAARIIWGTLDARLLAVDAKTGQLCTDFGTDGAVNLENGIGETVPGWYAITAAPTIVRGVVVTGAQVNDGQAEDSPSGVVRGYDAVSGQFLWAWDLGNPGSRAEPPEGQTYTRGTPNMWTTAAGDEALGLVYLPLGNSAVDYYGSNRSDLENEYATSLVAVDVTTGNDVWHFQTVHHDLWDYDLGSQPTLADFPTGNGTVPAIILSSKQGDIYVLDRATGKPLVGVNEVAAPQGGVEPGFVSPTQPSSQYHTLAFPDLVEADMWGMTPLDQLWCRIEFRRSQYQGIYTPPTTDQSWIEYPGYNGGNDWGSFALDSEKSLLIVNYNNMPNHNRLASRAEADAAGLKPIYEPQSDADTALGEAGPQIGSPYAIDINAGWRVPWTGLLCKEPPYGGIRAIDLATGKTVWDHPFGTARENGPFGLPSMLPVNIGTPNNGGPVVTAGGLIFIAASTDNLLHAIDEKTGETVWTDPLPGGGQANPMVVEVDGREMVVIAPGGHHFMETPISDAVVAYGLPESD